METNFINYFKCIDCHYLDRHTAGTLVVFKHPCIGYLLKGHGEFLYEGKKYEANEGDLVYIARGSRYYSVWTGEPDIHFYSINYSFSKSDEIDKYPFQIVRDIDGELLKEIMDNYETSPMRSIGLFYLFHNNLYNKLYIGKTFKNADTLLPALIYISENYTKKISVEHLAGICNLSESHFFSRFKKHMGCTPIQYKNNLTIQKALDLLSNTDKTIEEIGY